MCCQQSSSLVLQTLRASLVLLAIAICLTSPPALANQLYKRNNWNQAVGLWGKRSVPPHFFDLTLEKRPENQWNKLNSLWGKRSTWETANGLWGKRSSWQTANGLWGKRSPHFEERNSY
ncbi:unnamed protein product [Anisakis simplex]|uniref:Conserved secreted protein n=1 Tax=Anisakis simplex TaxID=6269 RepID=A0A0M3IY81_ANISI|nr:unnamed protein product [Anisakis simplex]